MNESGWDTSPPAPGRSLNGGHRGGRRAAASGHRADYSDSRDRTDAPSTPGRRAAYQLNVDSTPHRTPSPVPGRRPTGRRASVPLSDDWDDDAEGDLPYASPPPTASWRHQTASIPTADLDEDDDVPTVPQPERPDAAPSPQQPTERPAPERYEFEFEHTGWSQPAVPQPEPEPYQSYQPTYEPPRYEPEPQPERRWTPSWEQHTQAWSPDELSNLLDDSTPEQTSTSLFSAQPYVDPNADILPVEGYADELLGSDALGPGALPIDPEVHPAFPNDVLDRAIDAQGQADPLSDPVAPWAQEQPQRQPARDERPLFADDPYTLPQRMAQRDLQRAQEERDYAPPQHPPPTRPQARTQAQAQTQAQHQPGQIDLPPVQLTSADRGRPQRKPRPSGMSGKLAVLVSFGASLATAGIDLMLTDRLGLFFMLSSVLTAFGIAAAIRRPDVFTAGVLPPLAALGTFIVLGVLVPERLSGIESQPTAILAALASESWTLVAATGLALGTIAIRVAISRPPKQEEEPEPAPRQTYRNAA